MERVAIGSLRVVAWLYALVSVLVVFLGAPGIANTLTSTAFRGGVILIELFVLLQGIVVWSVLVLIAACAERYLGTKQERGAARWVQTTLTDPTADHD
jgi:hypothetical protein